MKGTRLQWNIADVAHFLPLIVVVGSFFCVYMVRAEWWRIIVLVWLYRTYVNKNDSYFSIIQCCTRLIFRLINPIILCRVFSMSCNSHGDIAHTNISSNIFINLLMTNRWVIFYVVQQYTKIIFLVIRWALFSIV